MTEPHIVPPERPKPVIISPNQARQRADKATDDNWLGLAQIWEGYAVLGDALAAVQALAEPYLDQPEGYQHYAVQIGDEVHLAVLLDDLRAALAGEQS